MYIFSICGPSGYGKSSLIKYLLDNYPNNFQLYPTIVDRPKRESEKSSQFSTYMFISEEMFDKMIDAKDFYEYERQSHNNYRYGKAKSTFNLLDNKKNALTEMRITKINSFKDALLGHIVVSFYLVLNNEDHLVQRLLARGDNLETIKNRVKMVREEEEKDMNKADYKVISYDGDIPKTAEEFIQIIRSNYNISFNTSHTND